MIPSYQPPRDSGNETFYTVAPDQEIKFERESGEREREIETAGEGSREREREIQRDSRNIDNQSWTPPDLVHRGSLQT